MQRILMNEQRGVVELFISWYFGLIGFVSFNWLPMLLSSIASVMAIVNYYYQIKKNRPK